MADKQATLRVVGVEIKSFLGLREFSFEPGRVTEISGKNGEGKTSTLSALQAALGGGNLANLRHLGDEDPDNQEEPEVVLVLEGEGDSNECYRIEKRGDSRTKVLARVGDSAAFEDLKRPEEWIKALSDRGCSFPLRWLEAADKDQVHMLLEALPIKFDEQLFLAEVGVQKAELSPIPKGLHPLEHVTLIRESVYNARTGVNRDQKAKAESAQQLKRDAPARLTVQDEREITKMDAQVLVLVEANSKAEAEIAAEHARQEEGVRSAFKRDVAKIRAAFDADVAKMRADLEKRMEKETADRHAILEGTIEKRKDEDEALLDGIDEERDKKRATLSHRIMEQASIQERLATLRERSKNSIKAKALLEKAEEFEKDSEDLAKKAKAMTSAIDKIDELKAAMAREIPIKGLEVKDGAVYIGQVPIRQVNRAQQYRIAIQVALLRANPRLPVIFVDDAEKLDAENYALFVEEVKKSGAQLFTARVTDDPFKLTTQEFGE